MIDAYVSLITTDKSWKDLVLDNEALQQVQEIKNWLKNSSIFNPDKNIETTLKVGYHTLFYGPAGAGKTLATTLIGKEFNKPVYKIDLSKLVSKYIGETEKNLDLLFAYAEDKNWILFFDEADSLFGKRTDVKDAQDRYANQEIAYLLQKIEVYTGLIVLATNSKTNIDQAFLRRLHSVIYFRRLKNRKP